jgi:hypothetical protein
MRRGVVARAVGTLCAAAPLASCARGARGAAAPPPLPPPPPRTADAGWDRDAARREVLVAALADLGGDPDEGPNAEVLVVDDVLQPQKTYEADYEPPAKRAADLVTLPGGRKVYRPDVAALGSDTFDDWVARSSPVPAPRDLAGTPRIEWLGRDDWKALPIKPAHYAHEPGSRWGTYRDRFPKSSPWLHVSDVGFSTSHDQALLQASRDSEGTSSGFWMLLRREGGRWSVAERRRTYIACGGGLSSAVTTTSD